MTFDGFPSDLSSRPIVAVCGAGAGDQRTLEAAEKVGRALALSGAILICGGLGGVMAAAAKGAKANGGLTIGLLPGSNRQEANRYIDIPLATGLGHARNYLIVRAAQSVIALPGGPGTLSEIALALKMGKTVIGLDAWSEVKGVTGADEPEEAVRLALDSLS